QGGNGLVTDKSFNGKSKASQMNTTRQQREAGDAAATRSSLMAIRKLLQVHPMPRLEDHVNALVRQLDTLESSIAGLQDQLQIGSSTLDDDNHLSMTPTPKTPTQRRLIQSLTKLKSRTPGGTRLQALQLTVSPKPAQIPTIEPPPNPPSPPKVEQEPIRDSLLDEPVPQSPTLPQSRLESLSRLVTSFWKSSTVIDLLTIYDPDLQIRLEKGNGTLNHQQTIEALENLINSYQSDTTGSVTPNKLIEANFYLELLKTLSDKGSNNLPCILHQDQWCVPLESMKQKLISICQSNDFNSSINTTIIYLLVGKLVVRIDRRANPILICVC
ncbi:hypothetical protein CROQUDRAFT_664232, partial [Cronartium quercuum f. sp. fusiforme G11]